MATQTVRNYSSSTGALAVFYRYNPTKGKNRLEHFSFCKEGETTQVALSKIWVNHWPVSHLKGFKSYLMPQEGVQFTQAHDVYEITVPELNFPTLSLTVKVLGKQEQILTLTLPEKLSVAGLKKIVSRKLEISNLGLLNLQHNGSFLDPNNTLEECAFENGTELTLNLAEEPQKQASLQEKITTGALEMGGGFNPLNFAKPDAPKVIPTKIATPQDPVWRIIDKGLNLKATCTEKTCKAFKQTVYIKKGMGVFNMAEECCEAKCPATGHSFAKDVNNCVFFDCLYSIKGMMEDGTKFNEVDKIAPKGMQALTFEETVNGASNIAKWKFLNITTKPSV